MTRPIATPATGARIGTPASIRARLPEHTVAMLLLPLLSSTSPTTRMTYGNSSKGGRTARMARLARFACPISRRDWPPMRFTSPVEYGGKL